ncbi:hypothetical protein GUJ93_ZPchr0013g34496 [Zizania palustris]|uniref:Homeobox domain-containing protein n=1 Tax=Zizania palustris TaxID=103762 RepID=A0A8J6BUX1_ZIZPA|nr:hypothetical protein GUJ93_ZPchr0013g34496 [Zizania palustris]
MEGSRNSPDKQSSGGSPVPEERGGRGSGGGGGRWAGEPVRSRWTPKPEQILILESIFNSGMVNPPKDETVRIRKLLDRFGDVGDANVFYWFQNRRSRSRRRQRQMQAAAAEAVVSSSSSSSSGNSSPAAASATVGLPSAAVHTMAMGGIMCQYEQQASSSSSSGSTGGTSSFGLFAHGAGASSAGGYLQASCCASASSALATTGLMGDVDSGGSDDLFAISREMGFVESPRGSSTSPTTPSSAAQQQQFYCCQLPSATITVFINGVSMEVPRGPIDLRGMFGQDVMLVHSTGALLPVNGYGILMQSLQMGESYFLVAI